MISIYPIIEQYEQFCYFEKMSTLIVLDRPETTVIDHGYHIYIDHSDPLAAEGFFSEEYDPSKNDKFIKKLGKCVKDVKNRDTSVDTKRWLITISKLNKRSLDKMSDFLQCKIFTKTDVVDDRKIIFQNDNIDIIEYSDKCTAVFVNKDPTGSIIKTIEEYSALANSGLTYIGMKKKRLGYLMPKRDKTKHDSFCSDLMSIRTTPESDDTIPDENGTETQPNSKDGNPQVLIWGTLEFVDEQRVGIDKYRIVEEREYSDGRLRCLIEILD